MATNVPILQVGPNLVVPVQGEPDDQLLLQLQSEVLGSIEQTAATGLVVDISAIGYVDSFTARAVTDLARMAGLMGTNAVVVGMSPAIAIVLMELGLELQGVVTARDLESGLRQLDELAQADGGGTDGA